MYIVYSHIWHCFRFSINNFLPCRKMCAIFFICFPYCSCVGFVSMIFHPYPLKYKHTIRLNVLSVDIKTMKIILIDYFCVYFIMHIVFIFVIFVFCSVFLFCTLHQIFYIFCSNKTLTNKDKFLFIYFSSSSIFLSFLHHFCPIPIYSIFIAH